MRKLTTIYFLHYERRAVRDDLWISLMKLVFRTKQHSNVPLVKRCCLKTKMWGQRGWFRGVHSANMGVRSEMFCCTTRANCSPGGSALGWLRVSSQVCSSTTTQVLGPVSERSFWVCNPQPPITTAGAQRQRKGKQQPVMPRDNMCLGKTGL